MKIEELIKKYNVQIMLGRQDGNPLSLEDIKIQEYILNEIVTDLQALSDATKEHPKSNDELLKMAKEPDYSTTYKMHDIEPNARKLAVIWGDNMVDFFITQKVKLASDIMNYAKWYSQLVNQEDAVKFAEWIVKNDWAYYKIYGGGWKHFSWKFDVKPISTNELYQEYLKQNL